MTESVLEEHISRRHGEFYVGMGGGRNLVRLCRLCPSAAGFPSDAALTKHLALEHPRRMYAQLGTKEVGGGGKEEMGRTDKRGRILSTKVKKSSSEDARKRKRDEGRHRSGEQKDRKRSSERRHDSEDRAHDILTGFWRSLSPSRSSKVEMRGTREMRGIMGGRGTCEERETERRRDIRDGGEQI